MFKNQKGFTLIEMLIVLVIISVLIILIIPNLSGRSKDVHEKGCKALVTVVQAQVDLYHIENGNFPSSLDVLVSDYISEDQKKCQNNKALNYNETSGTVTKPGN